MFYGFQYPNPHRSVASLLLSVGIGHAYATLTNLSACRTFQIARAEPLATELSDAAFTFAAQRQLVHCICSSRLESFHWSRGKLLSESVNHSLLLLYGLALASPRKTFVFRRATIIHVEPSRLFALAGDTILTL